MNFRIRVLVLCLFSTSTAFTQGQQQPVYGNYDSIANRLNANQLAFKTLSLRAKMDWTDDRSESDQDFQASIRILKDSLIWMSLTGPIGVEGFRVLITPDSFQSMNKMTNEYTVNNFDYIQNWLMFPVNFGMAEQIISGERIAARPERKDYHARASIAVKEDSSTYVLYNETDKMLEKIWVDTVNYTIQKILLKDKLLTQDMTITFDDYRTVEGKPFSYHRHLEVHRNGIAMKLEMDVTKLRWNENLTYPFEVSDKYKRR